MNTTCFVKTSFEEQCFSKDVLTSFFFFSFFDKLYEKKKPLKCGTCYNNFSGKQTLKRHLLKGFSRELFKRSAILFAITVKLDFKELLNKEHFGFKELFSDYQLFYTINLLLNKELLPV